MQRRDDGGLGTQLIGDKIAVNHRNVQVMKLLGEGEFIRHVIAVDLECFLLSLPLPISQRLTLERNSLFPCVFIYVCD